MHATCRFLELSDRTTERGNADLTVARPPKRKGGKWLFVYNGFLIRIAAKNVESRLRETHFGTLRVGDSLNVDLCITQEWSERDCAYRNRRYEITRIYSLLTSASTTEEDITYLNQIIEKASPIWEGVDVDEYLRGIRGIE